MKTILVNLLAIMVIVMGLMAFSITAPTTLSSAFTEEEECKKASCGECCGDVCRTNENGTCDAKDCSWLRELLGCNLE